MCRFTPRMRPRRSDTMSTWAPALFSARLGRVSSTFSNPSAANTAIVRLEGSNTRGGYSLPRDQSLEHLPNRRDRDCLGVAVDVVTRTVHDRDVSARCQGGERGLIGSPERLHLLAPHPPGGVHRGIVPEDLEGGCPATRGWARAAVIMGAPGTLALQVGCLARRLGGDRRRGRAGYSRSHCKPPAVGRRLPAPTSGSPPGTGQPAGPGRSHRPTLRRRSPVRTPRPSPPGQAPPRVMWTLRNTIG